MRTQPAPRCAVAGRIGRTNRNAISGTMRDDSRHRIAATVVLTENLREKPPDRDLRSEHAVSELHLMIVENRLNTRLGKHLTERQTVIVRKPAAQFVKCRHNQSEFVTHRVLACSLRLWKTACFKWTSVHTPCQ